jgi:hypothetical protein
MGFVLYPHIQAQITDTKNINNCNECYKSTVVTPQMKKLDEEATTLTIKLQIIRSFQIGKKQS